MASDGCGKVMARNAHHLNHMLQSAGLKLTELEGFRILFKQRGESTGTGTGILRSWGLHMVPELS